MRQILRDGIDRRYVLLPLLAVIALIVTAFFIAEARRSYTRDIGEEMRERQDRMGETAELIYAILEAESAQRGYILTGDSQYLEPYDEGRRAATEILAGLIERYSGGANAEEVAALQGIRTRIEVKFGETEETIRMMREGRPRDALAAVNTDLGLHYMLEIRDELEDLRARERQRIFETLGAWNVGLRVNTFINAGTTVFTVLLLVLVGLLATREIRRRNEVAIELEGLVDQRTAELRDLSAHMLSIGEIEKSALARELHDELGGLLVAMRMDLSQLRRRIALPDADAEARWQRVDAALTAGIELKRRVIEELRPTLLDNMGLVAALRWQAEQTCAQGGLHLDLDLPEEEPTLRGDAAIAVFRCVQEALSNTLKHARATRVSLSMHAAEGWLRVAVEDDGKGLPADALLRAGSHGLKQMRFRVQAVGGETSIAPVTPHGTRCTLFVPL